MVTSYFIWDGSPELFSAGAFTLRWNALLLIVAFILSRQLLIFLHKKESNSPVQAGVVLTYLVVATLVGARLGYVIFYQPELIWTRPAEIFLPLEFQPKFRFTGTEGLSIQGGLIGLLAGVWLYSRKVRAAQTWLQLLDKVAVIGALAGTLLFTGSFLNSEIIGRPTDSSVGTVYVNRVTSGIDKLPCCIMRNPGGKNPLDFVTAIKDSTPREKKSTGHQPIVLYLFFLPGATEQMVNEFLIGDVKTFLFDNSNLVYEPGTEPLHYTIFVERSGDYTGRIMTIGIARYPVQIFEAIVCFVLFVSSLWYWQKKKATMKPGMVFGLSLLFFCIMDFAFGFMKEPATGSETIVGLTIDQLLYVPLVLIAIVALTRPWFGRSLRDSKARPV
jgi:phosphatidylglycerol---prolipoprotein diacylglyceryl transferase